MSGCGGGWSAGGGVGFVAAVGGVALLGWQAESAIAITVASIIWVVFMTPSLRFPLLAGGTEWQASRCSLQAEGTERAQSAVPLAKRGEPKGGGQL